MLAKITDQNYLEILPWRNLPDNREVMFTQHEISVEEHSNWWEKTKEDDTKSWLIFEYQGKPMGVVNFFNLNDETKEVHWGFYFSDLIPTGAERLVVWDTMEREAVDYAFRILGMEVLTCETLSENASALAMHERIGFEIVGRDTVTIDGKNKDVVVMQIRNSHSNTVRVENSYGGTSPLQDGFVRDRIKIAFLGSSNMDFFESAFREMCLDYAVEAKVLVPSFGQYRIDTFEQESKLRTAELDYLFFCERVEDLLPVHRLATSRSLVLLESAWRKYMDYLELARGHLEGVFLVANPVAVSGVMNESGSQFFGESVITNFFDSCEREIRSFCDEHSNCYFINVREALDVHGTGKANPGKYYYLARAPFGLNFIEALCKRILSIVLADREKNARVIVLDLDNTTWGGVIGDDGIDGIQVGGDYPGNVHQCLQALFLEYRHQGFLLVLCSKNTESVALQVFDDHPEMLIKKNDLTAWRINWQPKPQNILELAEELDLGLASFCFIDDNPLERTEVRAVLPEVFVPELPSEVADWLPVIKELPELHKLKITGEDSTRNEAYKVRSKINEGAANMDRDQFLSSLGIVLSFEEVQPQNFDRVFQLLHKTNQFNATTIRPTRDEFEAMIASDVVRGVRIKDSLGSNEIIGVFVLSLDTKSQRAMIQNIVLSCRVLGRGVETAILSKIFAQCKDAEIARLEASIIETERNQPVRSLYLDHGFEIAENGLFEADLASMNVDLPSWIALEDVE